MKSKYPLIQIPKEAQATLFLIKQEIKTRKLFQMLREIGVFESPYESHLDSLILRQIAMDDGTDQTFAVYDSIVEKRTRKFKGSEESLTKQAFKVYVELVAIKRK